MMPGPKASVTEVQDFEQVIETTIHGHKPLIVGGHAVNIWALAYRKRPGSSIEVSLHGLERKIEVLHSVKGLKEGDRVVYRTGIPDPAMS